MKGKNLLLTALITLAAGILMILFRNSLGSHNVVIGAGVVFILAAVANMTIFLGSRDKDGHARMGAVGTTFGWIASGAALVLGVVMLLFRTVFEEMVAYMFGIILVCCALFQFLLLLFGSKPVRLSPWFFLVPMVLCGLAVYVFLQQPGQADTAIMLSTGVGLAFFGLMTMVEGGAISTGNRMLRKAPSLPDTAKTEEKKELVTPQAKDEPKESGKDAEK